jgi:hypothetical protein
MDHQTNQPLSEEEADVLRQMSSAIGISVEEMATVLGRNAEELRQDLCNPDTEEYKIYRREIILRKTRILNCIMTAAERDAPEAQKTALRIFDKLDKQWSRK